MTTCPLCGSAATRGVFSRLRPRSSAPTGRPTEALYGRAGPLVRCTQCGLVRQDPPADAPYSDAADPEYLDEQPGLRATFRNTLERIERHRPPPGRFLDIGCGPGLLVEEAAARGWDALGIEPSAWAVGEAQARGLNVRQSTLEELDAAGASFDAASLADVIEHVPDPLALMRRLYELMAPGAVVFCATPNVESAVARTLRRWWWSVLPGHIYLFSARTLAHLMREAGFEMLETTTHPKTFSVDYYVGRLVGYSSAVSTLARRAVQAVGAGERLITPDFRDRVAILARKPA
ncbi:MAG: class I SAM-dependent methyltransferase [Actinomycetota bacterium]